MEPSLGTSEYSSLSTQMKQIDSRLASLEKVVREINQKVSNKSFENQVNVAMQDLQDKVDALNTLIESHKVSDDDDCKVHLHVTYAMYIRI